MSNYVFELSDVSIANGNDTLTINNNDSVFGAIPGSMLWIDSYRPRLVQSVDNTARTVTLTANWDGADVVNKPAIIAPTPNAFQQQAAVDSINSVKSSANQLLARFLGLEANYQTYLDSKFDEIYAIVNGFDGYETLDDLTTTGAPSNQKDLAYVWNDPIDQNNGVYGWAGNAWIKSAYDVIGQLNQTQNESNLKFRERDRWNESHFRRDSTSYPYAIIDALGRALLAIDVDAGVLIGDQKLAPTSSQASRSGDTEPFAWYISDVLNRTALGITRDGFTHIDTWQAPTQQSTSRFHGRPVVWGLEDAEGRVALGVTRDGSAYAQQLDMVTGNASGARFSGISTLWHIADALGRVAFGITSIGSTYARALDMEVSSTTERRSRGDDLLWSLTDRRGTVALGVGADGAVIQRSSRHYVNDVTQKRFTGRRLLWEISDQLGRTAFGITDEGNARLNTVEQKTTDPSRFRQTADDVVWSIDDAAGKKVFGVDRFGRIFGDPSPALRNALNAASVSTPQNWQGDNAFSVRAYEGYALATIQAGDRSVFEVRKNNNSEATLVQHYAPLRFHPVGGQSNSGQAGTDTVLYNGAAYPHHCITFNTASQWYGTSAATDADLTGVAALSDAESNRHYPATTSAFALEYLLRQSGIASPGTFSFTSWWGGQPLESFVRGTNTFNNLMIAAAQAKTVAAQYGRSLTCPFYTFIQGENGGADYENALVNYANDVTGELASVLDIDTPAFVLVQINTGAHATAPNGTELAQLTAAQNNPSALVLAGPMYYAPMSDSIHSTAIGRMLVGEMLAACYQSILDSGYFTPLWPTSAVLSGNEIDIHFAVPGNGLALDVDWVAAVDNYGFVYNDDNQSAAIASVSIIDGTTVRVTLDQVPTGTNPHIAYAHATLPKVDHWSSGRGQLYSPSDIPSFFHSLGYELPATVRFYCVRFKRSL